MLTGNYIATDDEQTPSISAVSVGALRASTSKGDKYHKFDSGANAIVIPRESGIVGEEITCSSLATTRQKD